MDFRYEMDYHHFLFGVGLGAQYQYLCDGIAEFSDAFSRADKEGESFMYEYIYQPYDQQSSLINIELPITFGYNFATYGYFLVGAKVTLPLLSSYQVQTDMHTEGFYPWAVEAYQSSSENDFRGYGLFPTETYTQQQSYKEALRASANVEIGGVLPYNKKSKHRFRLGAFADFGFRVASFESKPLVDYSKVHSVPFITSQQQLADLIYFNPVQFSNKYSSLPYTIEVGIKLTWLVDVTISQEKCLLCEQNSRKHRANQRLYFK